MNRVERLRIDSQRTVTFIFGQTSIIKAFRGDKHTSNIKLPEKQALMLYEKFLRKGAQRIL
jgi:hypothetical protein